MGTSNEYKYKPEMTLQVRYTHNNKPIGTSMIEKIILNAYNEEPWRLDGEPEPLSVYLSGMHNGTVCGEFTAHAGFLRQVIKVSQQAAFERVCRRVAEALAKSAYTWCTSCTVQLNVNYETIDGELFRSH